eukprot:g8114.t1
MSSPETDGEEWSDDPAEHDIDASPQGLGYAPLDYQVLDDDQEGDLDDNNNNENGAGETETAVHEEDDANSQQRDVASAVLRAMEADYRACIESEARVAASSTSVSNGPVITVTPTTVTVEATSAEVSREEHLGSEPEANGNVTSTLGEEQKGDFDGGGGEGGQEGLATATAEVPPARPISPLGQDQAERVMRAMQGFSLAPPVPPPAGFEVDWGSADALANLEETATAAVMNTNRGVEEGGGQAVRRNGRNSDRGAR